MNIQLPQIPREVTPEMYNYFIHLHNNLRQLVEMIEQLQAKVGA